MCSKDEASPSVLYESELVVVGPPDVDSPLPRTPPRFQIRGVLGRGGTGVVYRAYDDELDIEVALKALHGAGFGARSWLKAEFRSLANITHPNLVQLYELVVDEQRCFFTMELVQGRDFLAYARLASESPARHIDLVREAAAQLGQAIAALHRAGKLHRDVKPSNVLVADDGRVVLLDFGLVKQIKGSMRSSDRVLAGTPEYMSPEQLWGRPLSEASDWYSFGVTLFEALTGEKPYDHAALLTVAARANPLAARPSALNPLIGEELDNLVHRLLEHDPSHRPQQDQILAVLGESSRKGLISLPPSAAERSQAPFLGRARELTALQGALAAAEAGRSMVACVSGPSGIGKSELIGRFLNQLVHAPGRLVLRGRCHPRETVPFNAFDEVIEDLTHSLAYRRSEASTPPGVDALVRLFPSFARIPPFNVLASAAPDTPQREVRRHAFAALRHLLAESAQQALPLIWLDDLQWADSDSCTLLKELLRDPAGLPLLLIATFRTEDLSASAALQALSEELSKLPSENVLNVAVGPLAEVDAVELVRALVGPTHTDSDQRLARLSREAEGSPFLLSEIARYLKHEQAAVRLPQLGVHDILNYRTKQLDANERLLLELVSVAGYPIDRRVLLSAAGLEASQLLLFRPLEQLSIVRSVGGSTHTTEVYHHQLRDHILGNLSAARREQHHRALAEALLAETTPSLQRVVEHYESAGDLTAVARHVVPAAREAADSLGFARAAALYRRALALDVQDVPRAELYAQLGGALANAGLGREAGEALREAAELTLANNADSAQLLLLRRQSAEQFLQSGHDKEAVEALSAVLSAYGVAFPETRGQALRWSTALRLRDLFRDIAAPTRAEADTPREVLDRFDSVWAVCLRMCNINHVRTSYFAARCLRAAFETREPSRIALGLAWEAAAIAMVPAPFFQKRARALLDRADELIAASGGAYHRAMAGAARAVAEWLAGDWRSALVRLDASAELIPRTPHGVSWEHALFDSWRLSSLAQLGCFKELLERVRSARAEGEARDDRYLVRNCDMGQGVMAWLALDQPDRALAEADRAIEWSPREYTTQHYQHFLGVTQVLLYSGRSSEAYQRSLQEWPLLRKHMFLSLGYVRDELAHLRARTALATAGLALADSRAAQNISDSPRELIRMARKDASSLIHHGLPCGAAWAFLLQAGAHRLEGNGAQATTALERAASAFQACEMRAYEQAARYCLGVMVGGDAGLAIQDRAVAWFRSEEVADPIRFMLMLAPGCLPLTAGSRSAA